MDSEINYFKELDVDSIVKGVGRTATDEELNKYLSKDIDAEPIDINKAFSKYLTNGQSYSLISSL